MNLFVLPSGLTALVVVDMSNHEPRNVLSYELFFADLHSYGVLEQIQLGCPSGNLGQFFLFA